MGNRIWRCCALLLAILLVVRIETGKACTAWAAIDPAPDGDVLIAKIRDEDPNQTQEFKAYHPDKGYAYFGLVGIQDDKRRFVAGVNEKGLVIVTLAASAVPKSERMNVGGVTVGSLAQEVLRNCANLAEVEAKAERLFSGMRPRFYLLADRSRAAWLEIGTNGAYSLRPIAAGVTAHANHYLDPAFAADNRTSLTSSRSRLARIQELLAQHPCPFSLDEFKRFSQDRHAGPNNSLFRTGDKTRTLAVFLARIPKNGGPPYISIELFTPGQEGETISGLLSDLLQSP